MRLVHPPSALLAAVVAALLGAGGGAAVVFVAGGARTTTTTIAPAAAPAQARTVTAASGPLSARQVYDRARGSVAFVTAQGQGQGQATGSGFVVSKQGLVVTNAHVVEGATAIAVKVGDGATLPATVVGRDESTDLALLRVRDAGGRTFAPLALADSGGVQVGDAAYAIGNPFGLDETLTSGIVSALDRRIDAPNGSAIDRVIQTDAPINPGNSGGPLLDDRGRAIGVTSQILNGSGSAQAGNVGIGFAIPSDTVGAFLTRLGVRPEPAPSCASPGWASGLPRPARPRPAALQEGSATPAGVRRRATLRGCCVLGRRNSAACGYPVPSGRGRRLLRWAVQTFRARSWSSRSALAMRRRVWSTWRRRAGRRAIGVLRVAAIERGCSSVVTCGSASAVISRPR